MTKDKAGDMLARMRNTATREKPIRIGDTDKRRVKELPRDPGERVSLDLSKEQHKALKRFALEAGDGRKRGAAGTAGEARNG